MIMSATQQYITLYEENRELITQKSCTLLNEARESALVALKSYGLEKSLDFTATDPEEFLSPDYALNLERHEVPVSREQLFTCSVPNLSTCLHYLINEQYVSPKSSSDKNIGNTYEPVKGVFVGSLCQFAQSYPEIARRYYNHLAGEKTPPCSQGEAALNTLLTQDGFVLYVPDDTQLDKPVQLINFMRSIVDFMACQRLLIIIGKRAKATLLVCDHSNIEGKQNEEIQLLSLATTEIFVDEEATFDYYELEEDSHAVKRLNQIFLDQKQGSNTAIGQFSLTMGETRNRIHIALNGEEAQTHLFGMAIAGEKQKVDNLTFISHNYPNCQSNELFKYVLDDAAQGGFVGRILVKEGAIKTEAYQTNRNLCLSKEARMMTRPELEIYADDVKCSHGATVGQLDNNALFYMRSRGIPEAEARLLLMFAFMGDVIDLIRLEPLRDRLKQLVEKRFRGELARCNDCKIKK